MSQLWYYAHRFSDADPAKQAENLDRARNRFLTLQYEWNTSYWLRRAWAPWCHMAAANIPEARAWVMIEACVRGSDGIVLDLDGQPATAGMLREREIAEAAGIAVEVLP